MINSFGDLMWGFKNNSKFTNTNHEPKLNETNPYLSCVLNCDVRKSQRNEKVRRQKKFKKQNQITNKLPFLKDPMI